MDRLVTAQRQRFVELLDQLAPEGLSQAPVPGVRLMKSSRSNPRSPVVYEPSIVIVGQGRKRGYLGDEVYTYDAYNYLVLSVPLPFECECQAEPGAPFLGLSVGVDSALLGELLLDMDEPGPTVNVPRGIYSTPLTAELLDAGVRLLECLRRPVEGKVLGRQVIREIVFRVLQGGQGGALRALAARQGGFNQIARILKRLHTDYSAAWDVETLASEAGMSVSAFHHHFKTVTSTSPLQYLKNVRLHKARLLMAQDGFNASMAATRVGYASPSQFSREFKRFFGTSPLEEAQKLREAAG